MRHNLTIAVAAQLALRGAAIDPKSPRAVFGFALEAAACAPPARHPGAHVMRHNLRVAVTAEPRPLPGFALEIIACGRCSEQHPVLERM
jgi:hypothetical protein